ncbi:class I SAM-dependent methyltransferase [Streptomyces sp. MS1.HAVA.3]|uniref:Class I SAM-dependent methyltransferase n=1 Tax=Streptomyces caledonius TaxID=3134107 RepID=A0ABU8U2C2_9ACTN
MLTRTRAEEHEAWGYTASTGLGFTHHGIVDAHFRACQDPYEHLLERAGIQRGWSVLDAGCGPGEFLPWLAELVGPEGRVSAIDLATENAALAAGRIGLLKPACPVDVRQGDLLRMPYPDDSFDAVWCANTVQYFDDRQLDLALTEMMRVVRPGGIVAVKELDAHLITARPADPYLFSDFFRAAGRTRATHGSCCARGSCTAGCAGRDSPPSGSRPSSSSTTLRSPRPRASSTACPAPGWRARPPSSG